MPRTQLGATTKTSYIEGSSVPRCATRSPHILSGWWGCWARVISLQPILSLLSKMPRRKGRRRNSRQSHQCPLISSNNSSLKRSGNIGRIYSRNSSSIRNSSYSRNRTAAAAETVELAATTTDPAKTESTATARATEAVVTRTTTGRGGGDATATPRRLH